MALGPVTLSIADAADGGGFTATLTGGVGGQTNALAAAQFTGRPGPLAWAAAGSRTGPGTITGTMTTGAGVYLWAVTSTLSGSSAVSAVVHAPLTASADSLHERIFQSVEARINALALPVASVQRMKCPDDQRGLNLPLGDSGGNRGAVVLTAFNQTEDYPGGTNGRDDTGFPVYVVFLTPGLFDGGDAPDATETYLRERVRRAFQSQRLDDVTPELPWCRVEAGPIVSLAAEGQTLAAGTLTLRFTARESRGVGA